MEDVLALEAKRIAAMTGQDVVTDTHVVPLGDAVVVRGRAQITLERPPGQPALSYPILFLELRDVAVQAGIPSARPDLAANELAVLLEHRGGGAAQVALRVELQQSIERVQHRTRE